MWWVWVVCVCQCFVVLFFFKQKTAYEMRISDWSSDVCSSDLLVTQWPLPIYDITRIGHSMGGLVIRSATAAKRHSDTWTQKVGNIICIGSPHQGAALERGAEALAQVLQGFELSRPGARVLEARSVGIRDLRFGATSDADWRAGLAREWRPPAPIARLDNARYHFIGCSIGPHAQIGRAHV